MGLGPSIKMTTLHHFRCPAVRTLSADGDVELTAVIVDGVSENCDDKLFTARRTARAAELLGADGAIVAIDGWGNHHVDFVSVIGELGRRGIPSVGLSYLGTQGKLVCANEYVDCVVDFNKSAEGFESCVVGQNELTALDAWKALALLKNKMRKAGKPEGVPGGETRGRPLTLERCPVRRAAFGRRTELRDGVLTVEEGVAAAGAGDGRLERVSARLLPPGERNVFVNSNLDFSPVACKLDGCLGEGTTRLLAGLTVMLTGAEAGGFQPANIGSSEGTLGERVVFGRAGTPGEDDWLLHVDVRFREGEGRTAAGIQAAHTAADRIVSELRAALRTAQGEVRARETLCDVRRPGRRKVVLVKIVSGLGNMYDTALFPDEPGGIVGAKQMRLTGNLPYLLTANEVRDGAIHSLL